VARAADNKFERRFDLASTSRPEFWRPDHRLQHRANVAIARLKVSASDLQASPADCQKQTGVPLLWK
jgi:hypothetical protein